MNAMENSRMPNHEPVEQPKIRSPLDSLVAGFDLKRAVTYGLLAGYLLLVLLSGYWYWIRPVRGDQFKNAVTWWTGIALVYDFPVPLDERWE